MIPTKKVAFQKGERLTATVEKVVFGGPGLCRTDRGVVFVDYAAPNEKIEIEITSVKKDFARARLLRILTPSSDRVEARCKHFTHCGGCDWQHLSSASQLRAKQEIVEELFRKNFNFASVKPIIASPQEWNYRNRIQMIATEKGLSYTKKRSHDLLPVHDCLIAEDAINGHLKNQRKFEKDSRIQISARGAEALSGDSEAFEFSQVNTKQNENLVKLVLDTASEISFTKFVDLYGGSGNFSFPLIEKFPKVSGIGVELDAKLVSSAQNQVQKQNLQQRLQFFCASVDASLRKMDLGDQTLIVVDPPRAGMGPEVSQILARQSAAAIVYVSCNPMTLVRDLKDLTTSTLWQLGSVQPVDMFPQTSHIEVLVTLLPNR